MEESGSNGLMDVDLLVVGWGVGEYSAGDGYECGSGRPTG